MKQNRVFTVGLDSLRGPVRHRSEARWLCARPVAKPQHAPQARQHSRRSRVRMTFARFENVMDAGGEALKLDL